jgi:hypothetical protein
MMRVLIPLSVWETMTTLPRAESPDRQEPLFTHRMVRVWKRPRERIAKHRRSLVKRDPVLLDVALLLSRIPFEFEFHAHTVRLRVWFLNCFLDERCG